MIEEPNYEWLLDGAEKTYFRGGSILKNILSKQYKVLSGQDLLDIFNTYGIPVQYLKILVYSHGFEMNEKEFIHLLKEQTGKMKNLKPRCRMMMKDDRRT